MLTASLTLNLHQLCWQLILADLISSAYSKFDIEFTSTVMAAGMADLISCAYSKCDIELTSTVMAPLSCFFFSQIWLSLQQDTFLALACDFQQCGI